jgi:hypothetical protein
MTGVLIKRRKLDRHAHPQRRMPFEDTETEGRQRQKRCILKPRNVWGDQKLEETSRMLS